MIHVILGSSLCNNIRQHSYFVEKFNGANFRILDIKEGSKDYSENSESLDFNSPNKRFTSLSCSSSGEIFSAICSVRTSQVFKACCNSELRFPNKDLRGLSFKLSLAPSLLL